MKRCALFLLCLLLLLPAAAATRPAYDLIIRNGRVLDGAGNPWVYAEIGIRGDRIVKIARRIDGAAKRVIDARGQAVSPGFIDMHTHSDTALLLDGNAQSKIRQGVTTEILGESGSVAPVCPAVLADNTGQERVKRDWKDLEGYFTRLRKQGTSVNVGSYVAGGTVRMCGMGAEMREPTPAELEKMKMLVQQAMLQGALGYSTGLIYPPNSYARTDELVEMARVAAQYGGIYTSHLRGESATLLESIDEALTIGEQAKIPVHILHLKSTGNGSGERMRAAIEKIDGARARGLEVGADQYPYIASSTGLATQVPQWVQDGGNAKMLERLRDPETRARIREAVLRPPADPEKMVIATVRGEANKQYQGMTIGQAATLRHEDPRDTILNLLAEENGRVSMVYFTMKEEDVREAMRQSWVSVGSDGTAVSPEGPLGEGKPHPRFYGAHARVLGKYVREEHVLALEEAVRKMTSLAAQQMGIRDRGLLAEGMKADVVVFDPERVADKATFQDPHQFAEGVQYVVVNGTVVVEEGRHTGARPGQIVYGAGRAGKAPAVRRAALVKAK